MRFLGLGRRVRRVETRVCDLQGLKNILVSELGLWHQDTDNWDDGGLLYMCSWECAQDINLT